MNNETNNNSPQPVDVVGVPELKSCPFCGKESKIEEFFIDDDPQPWYVVTCTVCPVKTYDQTTPQEAARAWNTRAAQPATTPTIFALVFSDTDEEFGAWNEGVFVSHTAAEAHVAGHLQGDPRYRIVEIAVRGSAASVTPPDVTERARQAIDRAIGKTYEPTDSPTAEGTQMLDGKWLMPLYGCDTLDYLRDRLTEIMAAEFGRGEIK